MSFPPTCVEDMYINLPERLVILPGAVAPKGVHLVAHRHGSMVDSPRPSFQVHRPAQHSTRCESSDHHFVARLDAIKPTPLTLVIETTRGAALCLWAQRSGSGSRGEHKGELFVLLAKGCTAFCCWQTQKPPYYLSWEDILGSDL